MINIIKTRKAMKAEIADLTAQLCIQSERMAAIEKTNLRLNADNDALRDKNDDQASTIANLRQQLIEARQHNNDLAHEVAQLQDANCGLASSVSDLKKKLTALQKAAKETTAAKKPRAYKPKTNNDKE